MLQAIRDKAGGVIGWTIIGSIIVVFAFWGLQSWLGESPVPSVAKINGTAITQSKFNYEFHNQQLPGYTRRYGPPTAKKIQQLKRQYLNQQVDDEILRQAAGDSGYFYQMEQFKRDVLNSRAYPPARINYELQRTGMNLPQFLETLRSRLYQNQFYTGITGTEFYTETELKSQLSIQHRKIQIEYIRVQAGKLARAIKISDQQLRDYHKKNQAAYMTLAQAKFSYLRLNYSDYAKGIKLTPKDIQSYYDQYKTNYRVAGLRKATHILIKLKRKANAKQIAVARIKANEVYRQLSAAKNADGSFDKVLAGVIFKKLVKSHSDDKFVAPYNVDPLKQKVLYKGLDKVNLYQHSRPIRTAKGFYVLKLTASTPGKIKPLTQVRKIISDTLLKNRATVKFNKAAELFANDAFENDNTLDVAADSFKLKIQTTDWISKKGVTPKGASQKMMANALVREAAFNADVYAGGDAESSRNSSLVRVNTGKPDMYIVILRLKEYKASAAKPFAEVKASAKQSLLASLSSAQAKKLGEKLLKQVQDGPGMKAVSKAASRKMTDTGLIGRFDQKHSVLMVTKAFALGVPQKDKKYSAGVQLANGDYMLFSLVKSENGSSDKISKQSKRSMAVGNALMFSRSFFGSTVALLRKSADITLNTRLILSSKNEN